jgi:hypothetical protein
MNEMEACERMARWLYLPEERPGYVLASQESLWRMLDGLTRPESEWKEFAASMVASIREACS